MSVISTKSNTSAKPSAKTSNTIGDKASHLLSDFTTDPRVVVISAIAVFVSAAGVLAGAGLLQLIKLATNIAYFGQFSFADLKLQDSPLGLWTVL
ncbi:MAG TPA: chloride channel protein, partial [Bradyrhizobium sp.]